MAASKSALGDLHEHIALLLIKKAESGEMEIGELNAAIKFLKDNGIEAMTNGNSRLTELADSLPTFGEDEQEDIRFQ